MSFDHERRRHRRYPLRLAIKLHRGSEEMEAHIINASTDGCLLLSSFPLEAGEVLEASIPELMIPRTKLHIQRCEVTSSGYMAAASFDPTMVDESPLSLLSGTQQLATPKPRWLN
jgi:hypothetical protein